MRIDAFATRSKFSPKVTLMFVCVCVFDQRGQLPITGRIKKHHVTMWLSVDVKRIATPSPSPCQSTASSLCALPETPFSALTMQVLSLPLTLRGSNPPSRFCRRHFTVSSCLHHREVTSQMGLSLSLSLYFGTHNVPVKHDPTHTRLQG